MIKYHKMPILRLTNARVYDGIMFVGSIDSLQVALTVCYSLGLLRFSLPKSRGGVYKLSVPTFKFFQFPKFFLNVW